MATGVSANDANPPVEDDWYATRRNRWMPSKVRLLIIAESPPDDGGIPLNRRYFYDDDLTRHDGLFRELCRVLFEESSFGSGPGKKVPYLERLRSSGVFLIDLSPGPVNYLTAGARRDVLSKNVPRVVAVARLLEPDGVVIIKRNVFELLAGPIRAVQLPLLNDGPIPFPGSGQQARFRQAFQRAVAPLEIGDHRG